MYKILIVITEVILFMIMKCVLLVLVLVTLGLNCCKMKGYPNPYWGTASAWFNEAYWNDLRSWQVRVYASTGANADLTPCQPVIKQVLMEKANVEGSARERFYIDKIPSITGTYPMHIFKTCEKDTFAGAGYYLVGADGDVLLDSYRVLETEDK